MCMCQNHSFTLITFRFCPITEIHPHSRILLRLYMQAQLFATIFWVVFHFNVLPLYKKLVFCSTFSNAGGQFKSWKLSIQLSLHWLKAKRVKVKCYDFYQDPEINVFLKSSFYCCSKVWQNFQYLCLYGHFFDKLILVKAVFLKSLDLNDRFVWHQGVVTTVCGQFSLSKLGEVNPHDIPTWHSQSLMIPYQ